MYKYLLSVLITLFTWQALATDGLTYQKPPKEILALADYKRAPYPLLDEAGQNMVLIYRDNYKSIADLSKPELRLGGLRIDPQLNIGSRETFYNDLKIQRVGDNKTIAIKGLPQQPRLSYFVWSPDQKHLAMLDSSEDKVQLWVINIEQASARRLKTDPINANMRSPVNWLNNHQLLVKIVPSDRKPLIDKTKRVPIGPTVTESHGEKAQNRTYQDLLKNKDDEYNFEQLARSEIIKVSLDGAIEKFAPAAMYGQISVSPNQQYVLLTRIKRPFSYIVPYYRFPQSIAIYTASGSFVKQLADVPLNEVLPKGFMSVRTGKRSFQWRSDQPANIVWAEALDGGDPAVKVPFRDAIYQLDAPFGSRPKLLIKLQNRLSDLAWGDDHHAVATDYWWNDRNIKSYLFDPSDTSVEPKIIEDRNYQDRYSDPGSIVTKRNRYGREQIVIKNNQMFRIGDGFSEKGQFPFLDAFDLKTLKSRRIYQSSYTDRLESIRKFDTNKNQLLVRIESKTEFPNYYFRDLSKTDQLTQITDFDNPFKSLNRVHKEVIRYQRDDGLELSATLYLPLNYEQGKKYPMLMWAYPREFKDKSSAAQNTKNPNRFVYPYYGSPIYWVTRGYVVLDDAAFPIIGEGEKEPNDTFRSQLVANAKAAIDTLDARGLIDRNRVAVGGHSYGAFMVANLLSHSNLFAAGIARSGAYNRTLTPFGFQSEERSYWEAPEVYYRMSPFMHADKLKAPILLIHGEADNNSGTYPLQSERYFNALKGLGKTARLVMLPKESHGYRAKESVLHVLWEQDRWLEKYVKNKN